MPTDKRPRCYYLQLVDCPTQLTHLLNWHLFLWFCICISCGIDQSKMTNMNKGNPLLKTSIYLEQQCRFSTHVKHLLRDCMNSDLMCTLCKGSGCTEIRAVFKNTSVQSRSNPLSSVSNINELYSIWHIDVVASIFAMIMVIIIVIIIIITIIIINYES